MNTSSSKEQFICDTSRVRVQILQPSCTDNIFLQNEMTYVVYRERDTSLGKRSCRHFILDNKTLLELQLQEALCCQDSEFKSA